MMTLIRNTLTVSAWVAIGMNFACTASDEDAWGDIERQGAENTMDVVEVSEGLYLENSMLGGELQLLSENTGYGRGQIQCPSGMVALGGGANCTDGELDVTYPYWSYMNGYRIPLGWEEWHRGASSRDCKLYAICVPRAWFETGQLKVEINDTGYGQGSVSCLTNAPAGMSYRAIGGGSRCTDGDLDMAVPNSNLTGYEEWHRGASSRDCQAYAVCVRSDHWLFSGLYYAQSGQSYGFNTAWCEPGDIVLGGGSRCTDGDCGDFDFPRTDLAGWRERHRGRSSYDCYTAAACLRSAAIPANR